MRQQRDPRPPRTGPTPRIGGALPTAALLLVLVVGCSSSAGVGGTDALEGGEDAGGGSDSAGSAVVRLSCPTLADLEAGYEWSTSITGGDSADLCAVIDCETWAAGWSGNLFVGADGLFRLGLYFHTSWGTGFGGSTRIHVDGVARMPDCETLIVTDLFDYTAADEEARGCRIDTFDEVDSRLESITFQVAKYSDGKLLLLAADGSIEFHGGQFLWDEGEIAADAVHAEADRDFASPLCDPLTGRNCPPGGIGDPCTGDADCVDGHCNGTFCTKPCGAIGEEADCQGACQWGQNTLRSYNVCAPDDQGALACMPRCPETDAGVPDCAAFAAATCQNRVSGGEALHVCGTSCSPNTQSCANWDYLLWCDASGAGVVLDCVDVCADGGWGAPQRCRKGDDDIERCLCSTAPCAVRGDVECVGDARLRTCEYDGWQPRSCADVCAEEGLGAGETCVEEQGLAWCRCGGDACAAEGEWECTGDLGIRNCQGGRWRAFGCETVCVNAGFAYADECDVRAGSDICLCGADACDQEGARECVDEQTVRLCDAGYWLQFPCADHCRNYGYATTQGCQWQADQGAWGCVCP